MTLEEQRVERVVPIGDVKPNTYNYRGMRKDVYEKEMKSIQEYGFIAPPHVRSSNEHGPLGFYELIDGEHRWRACSDLGYKEIPVNDLGMVPDRKAKKLCIILNETHGEPKYEDLSSLLASLAEDDMDDLIEELPFPDAELRALAALPQIPDYSGGAASAGGSGEGQQQQSNDGGTSSSSTERHDGRYDKLEVPKDPVTKHGDMWLLGDHMLLCGDCRNASDVARVMDGEKATVVFTSPPYADQRVYDHASGFVPIKPEDYVEWFELAQENVREVLATDGSFFVNIKPHAKDLDTELYVFDLVLTMVRNWGWHFATEFCWERVGRPGRYGKRFKNQFEPIYQFALGAWKFRPDAVARPSDSLPDGAIGPGGEKQGDPESIPEIKTQSGMALPGNRLPQFRSEAKGHPAAFPVGLPTFFALAYSDVGDIMLDPFAGSGSSILAAERTNRVGRAIEISPGYCDLIVARWEQETGQKAKRHKAPSPAKKKASKAKSATKGSGSKGGGRKRGATKSRRQRS